MSLLKYLPVLLVLLVIGFIYFELEVDAAIRLYYPKPLFSEKDIPSLKGKVAIVTGGNVGLGKESARMLAAKGAKVVIACRSNCDSVVQEMKAKGGDVLSLTLDLSDSKSVFDFAQQFKKLNLPLHILMLNAGVMLIPDFRVTKDDFEMHLCTNWLGHFYLQQLLQGDLEKSAPSRIVIVSAKAQELVSTWHPLPEDFAIIDAPVNRANYNGAWHYAASKLLNIVHAKYLAKKMKAENKQVEVLTLHPGVVDTELGRYVVEGLGKYLPSSVTNTIQNVFKKMSLPVHDGALTQVYAAVSPEVTTKNLSGAYLRPIARVEELTGFPADEALQKKAWERGLKLIEKFPRLA